jgi:hypothetical protein
MPQINDHDKNEVAKMHLDRFWHEIFWRRESEQKITVWSVGFFAAVLVLVYGKTECMEWQQKLLLVLLIAILGLLSCIYLYRNARKNSELGFLIVRLNEAMGAWEKGYLIPDTELYPVKWKEWGINPEASSKEWFFKLMKKISISSF